MKIKQKIIIITIIVISFLTFNIPTKAKENNVIIKYPITNYQYKNLIYIEGNYETLVDNAKLITKIDNNITEIEYETAQNNSSEKTTFYKTINTEQINDGKHELKLELIDTNNNILASTKQNIEIKKHSANVSLNYPVTNYQYKDLMYIEGEINTDCNDYSIEINMDEEQITDINFKDKLFYKVLNTSNLSNGTHQINIKLKNNLTNEIIATARRNFEIKNYDIDLILNYPINNYQYKDLMYIEGQLTEDFNGDIKLFIDDEYTETQFEKRGKTFYTVKNLNAIKDGEHNLKVALFLNDKEIASKTKKMRIKKHESIIAIEYPIENYLYNNVMYIQGYALTDCSDSNITIKIDEEELTGINRYDRNELQKYNYLGSTKNSGYYTAVDTTNLTNGEHTITAQIKNNLTGEIINETSKKIRVKKFNADIKIQYPLDTYKYKDQMYVEGYADNDIPDSIVEIYIDETMVTNQANRHNNDTVNYKYSNSNQGFHGTFDVSNLKDGKHKLRINIKSQRFPDEIVETKTKEFNVKKYDGIIIIETPTTSQFNNSITIAGYEMSELDNSYIKIFIDNIDITHTLASPVNRTEYDSIINTGIYGGASTNSTPGFNSTIDLALISAGKHNITVKLYTKLDEEISSYTKTILVYKNVSFGIDVSSHNTITNWKAIKNDGIDYAFIRAAYRGYGFTGTLNPDIKFAENTHGAIMAGIKIGAYVYSQAINEQEAIEEANLIISLINREGGKNTFTLPIVFDTEYTPCWLNGSRCGRADYLTKEERTRIARAFLERIKEAGYTPMLYSNKYFLYSNLNMNELSEYEIWMANFLNASQASAPLENPSNYTGPYQVWQYYSEGSIAGINGNVDLNVFYKQY